MQSQPAVCAEVTREILGDADTFLLSLTADDSGVSSSSAPQVSSSSSMRVPPRYGGHEAVGEGGRDGYFESHWFWRCVCVERDVDRY